jgi:hypothetical protein
MPPATCACGFRDVSVYVSVLGVLARATKTDACVFKEYEEKSIAHTKETVDQALPSDKKTQYKDRTDSGGALFGRITGHARILPCETAGYRRRQAKASYRQTFKPIKSIPGSRFTHEFIFDIPFRANFFLMMTESSSMKQNQKSNSFHLTEPQQLKFGVWTADGGWMLTLADLPREREFPGSIWNDLLHQLRRRGR